MDYLDYILIGILISLFIIIIYLVYRRKYMKTETEFLLV